MDEEEVLAFEYLKKIERICEDIEETQSEWAFRLRTENIRESAFCAMEELKMIIGENQLKKWERLSNHKKAVNE